MAERINGCLFFTHFCVLLDDIFQDMVATLHVKNVLQSWYSYERTGCWYDLLLIMEWVPWNTKLKAWLFQRMI